MKGMIDFFSSIFVTEKKMMLLNSYKKKYIHLPPSQKLNLPGLQP